MTAAEWPPAFVCPSCGAPLALEPPETYTCASCGRAYPVVCGIPDLRLRPDRYLTLEDDRDKARALDALGLDFAGTVAAYWARTPEVPADLAEKYTAAAVAGVERGRAWLDNLGVTRAGDSLLDVGCGTGGVVVAAALAGMRVAGADIALRWLVVARRALDDAGVDALLVAADGARLPFAPGTFDTVVSIESLEHTDDQAGFVAGCLATTAPGGRTRVVTANRTTIAIEPTSNLWGVGFLPRPLAARYVRWRRHTRYQWFRAVTARELRTFARGAAVDVVAAPLPAGAGGGSSARRAVTRVYDAVRAGPLARAVRPVVPYLELRGGPVPLRSRTRA
jgi:SAM-dependent methyltransferase